MEQELVASLVLEAATLGVHLGVNQGAQLALHLHLLQKWNMKLNLVGPGDLRSWGRRHSLDSLAVTRWIAPGKIRILDVGSGAGFPGISVAIARPEAQVTLLEPRSNRAAFLQNVVAGLGICVRVVADRAEAMTERFDLVMGRAVAPPVEWSTLAARLCGDAGKFVLFLQGGEPPTDFREATRADWFTYRVPGEPKRSIGLYVPRGT